MCVDMCIDICVDICVGMCVDLIDVARASEHSERLCSRRRSLAVHEEQPLAERTIDADLSAIADGMSTARV